VTASPPISPLGGLILKVLGRPFKDGGRGPDEFDCWGLYRYLLLRSNHWCPDYPRSGDPAEDAKRMLAAQDEGWDELPGPIFAAAVLLRCAGQECHVGFVLDEQRFVHIFKGSIGVLVSEFADPRYARAIIGFYRYSRKAWPNE
jgi:cell wall-associated NlpC family hydrolase